MRVLVFLDFDRTLFDTGRLIDELAKMFKEYGDLNFIETMPKDEYGNYSMAKHIDLITSPANREKVKILLGRLFAQGQKFLFDDCRGFLEMLSIYDLFLVTRGEKAYQYAKIQGALSDFIHLFKDVIVTESDKSPHIEKAAKRISPAAVFFVDDKIAELEPVKKLMPDVTTILISRGGSEAGQPAVDFTASSLMEAAEIIFSKIGDSNV